MAHDVHDYWLNAAARNIAETTAGASHCGFLRRLPRAVDALDLIVCAALLALMAIYQWG